MRQPIICQACGQRVRPTEPYRLGPAPDGGTWYLHFRLADCIRAALRPTQEARHAA